ncbi:MAG: hypothetical protein JWO36_5591 [Myxococcales bacterium]|nr:hypothetical protein [Myxococcales bacterium]
MSFGIVEVITLLLGLSGFGVQPNPKSPTGDQALQYAMADADLVVEFDAASVIPGNYKVLQQLADQPQVKASPELAKMVRKAVNEVEGARGLAKTLTGIDVTSDISDATAFVQIVPKHDPNLVVAVHGKFTIGSIDKIASMVHKPTVKAGAGAWVDMGDGNAIAITKDGVLLAGTDHLIKDRVADTWKAPSHAAGTNLGYAADMINGKPVFGFLVTLSATARTEALAKHDGKPNFLTDLIKRHKLLAFSIYRDGVGWSWIDSTKTGLESMTQLSDGAVDIMRAGQIAPRGLAKVVLGAIDSYKGVDKQIDELIRHKADVLKLVDTYTGDGSFKAQVDADPKALRLNVRLTGKTLSEVLPLGGLVPFAAAGFFFALKERSEAMSPPIQISAPPPTAVPAPKRSK